MHTQPVIHMLLIIPRGATISGLMQGSEVAGSSYRPCDVLPT